MAEPTPVLTPREKAITHVTNLSKNPEVAKLAGQPGFNVFAVLTPVLTQLADPAVKQEVIDAAMKLDAKPDTYAVKRPVQATDNSTSPMVQALVEGARPVPPPASKLG